MLRGYFAQLGKKLYLKYSFEEEALADLLKERVKLLGKPASLQIIDGLEESIRSKFLRQCQEIAENPIFNQVIDGEIERQRQLTLEQAQTEKQFLCGKLSIYGVNQVRERFKSLGSMLKIEQDQLDPFSII